MRRATRLLISAALALVASGGLAFAKDSVTIGIVLEPPGLDPTTAPAAAIGEVTHYTIFEGLTKINEDFSVTPLLAEKWTFSPDLKTLTFTLKPNVKFQDGEPFTSKDVKSSFERYGAKDFDQQGQSLLRLDRVDRDARPADRRAAFQGAELPGAVSSGHRNRRDHRREERGERGDQPGRHRPLQVRLLDQRAPRSPSTSGTAIATRPRFRSRTRPSASSPIPSAEVDGDARRRRRRLRRPRRTSRRSASSRTTRNSRS